MGVNTVQVGDITVSSAIEDAGVVARLAYQQYMEMTRPIGPEGELETHDLETIRAWALVEVQRVRGEVRKPFVPDTYGQSSVYLDKALQVRRWRADPAPKPDDYPVVYGEGEARGLDPNQMAELIEGKAGEWRAASDKIETLALSATGRVESAQGIEVIVEALVELWAKAPVPSS